MWKRTIALPWYIQLVLWPSILATWIIAWAFRDMWVTWILLVGAILGTVLAASCTVFRVSIGPAGIRAASLLGVPSLQADRSEIAQVSTTRVNPLGDFFGWGYRIRARGDKGIITRAGPALEVKTDDGRTITVTVPDAEAAADALRESSPV